MGKCALNTILMACMLMLPVHAATPKAEPAQGASQDERTRIVIATMNEVKPIKGKIMLAKGAIELNVPPHYYYLSPEDTEKVLVRIWGNPPGAQTLGMILPEKVLPFEPDSWGVLLRYSEDGYVSDQDASTIDFDDLLARMKEDTAGANGARKKAGFEPVTLVGWAVAPRYDAAAKKLYWAKELKFGDSGEHTLNYSIRMLGRAGVLELNFVANMSQLAMINQNLHDVLAIPGFRAGHRYDEFNPDLDKVAAYGIGALIAGKVLAKTGLLVLLIAFLKKFGIFIVIALGALGAKLLRRKNTA